MGFGLWALGCGLWALGPGRQRRKPKAKRQRPVSGLRNSHGRTLQDIADRLGVTKERVRQIEKRALDRLRRAQDGSDANVAA